MKKNCLKIAGLFILLSVTACNNKEDEYVIDMLPKTRAVELTPEQKTFVAKNNDFAFNLFKVVNELSSVKTNELISPISVTYNMGMLNDGAAGNTSKEITSILGFGIDNNTSINEFCRTLIENAPQTDPNVLIKIANYIAINQKSGLDIKKQYQNDMVQYYHAEVKSLDFSKSNTLREINDWCSKQTDGDITSIIEKLDADAIMILMNAIKFRATWTDKFDPENTKNEVFILENGETKQMPLMHQNAEIRYYENPSYSMIQLPYGSGDKWSMYVLLPNSNQNVDDIINNMTCESWNKSLQGLRRATVDIKIPRFKAERETDLIPVISKMGAPTLFTPSADLSGIATNSFNLYVSLMKQKVSAEINEEGTKMSAVTMSEVLYGANINDYQKIDFHANRPFVYVIQEASSGTIFFIGTFRGE